MISWLIVFNNCQCKLNFNKLSQLFILWIQFDTGVYRYAAAKTSIDLHFVPTVVGYFTRFAFIASLITLTALQLKSRRVS